MFARLWCRFADWLRVQLSAYRSTLIWLMVWLVGGIVLGIVTLLMSEVGVDDINYRLIDGNILNATSISAGLGSFIWQRILSVLLPVVVVFVLAALSRVTAYAIFPVVFMHGYWLAVAVWWVWFFYGFTAILLLAFYVVWLVVVTAVLLAGLLWAYQWGGRLRTCPRQCQWWSIIRGVGILVGVAIIMGVFEYLVFWTVLGKIVYKPV